jgi:hypothetical protein
MAFTGQTVTQLPSYQHSLPKTTWGGLPLVWFVRNRSARQTSTHRLHPVQSSASMITGQWEVFSDMTRPPAVELPVCREGWGCWTANPKAAPIAVHRNARRKSRAARLRRPRAAWPPQGFRPGSGRPRSPSLTTCPATLLFPPPRMTPAPICTAERVAVVSSSPSLRPAMRKSEAFFTRRLRKTPTSSDSPR